ncbi:MAG: ArsA family ATPase [Deltaproteobacteria bacterium]|nr:ArsA family ATPase [Deltaproteobacteria bacterium]
MPLNDILTDGPKLIMVGGKGGVGKTTCASAIALEAATQKRRVLIISSDPTPSLSDIFELHIGSTEKRILRDLDLYGLEISSDVILNKWKDTFGDEIYEVISSFANVEYDFVDYIGTAPGIEEEYMLHFIIELVEASKYDLVVWDTAPAGHTLKLLKLPQLFLKHMEAATKFYMNLYSYFEKIKDAIRLKESKKTLLEIIASWEKLAEKIVSFIRDTKKTRYVIVTIPEALGVSLTERVIREFRENGLSVDYIIINNVIREADCEFHKIRKKMQESYIRMLAERYSYIKLVELPLFPEEVKGYRKIEKICKLLFPK